MRFLSSREHNPSSGVIAGCIQWVIRVLNTPTHQYGERLDYISATAIVASVPTLPHISAALPHEASHGVSGSAATLAYGYVYKDAHATTCTTS